MLSKSQVSTMLYNHSNETRTVSLNFSGAARNVADRIIHRADGKGRFGNSVHEVARTCVVIVLVHIFITAERARDRIECPDGAGAHRRPEDAPEGCEVLEEVSLEQQRQ